MSDLHPLPPDIAALLREERSAAPPPDDARARIRARLDSTLGLAAAGAAGATLSLLRSSGKMAAAKGSAAIAGKLALGIALGTSVLGTAAYLGWRVTHASTHAARVASSTAGQPSPPAMELPRAPVPAPAPIPLPVPSVAPTPPATPARSRHHADEDAIGHLREEHALLATARAALAASDPRRALTSIERHARRFPDGQLAEERECLRIRALAGSGDDDAVAVQTSAFSRAYPHSLLQPNACRDGND